MEWVSQLDEFSEIPINKLVCVATPKIDLHVEITYCYIKYSKA